MNDHEVSISKKFTVDIVNCDHCQDKFNSQSALEKHMIDNNVADEFKCDECNVTLFSKWRLQKHMKNHSKRQTRNCHYFNSNKKCPFQHLGCKFPHRFSVACRNGVTCNVYMCQFKH